MPPCGVPRLRSLASVAASHPALVALDDRCREPALDDGQDRAHPRCAGHAAHQAAVGYRIEVVAAGQHPPPPVRPWSLTCQKARRTAILASISGRKPYWFAQQVRLEDRADHQQRRHLDHAVADARECRAAAGRRCSLVSRRAGGAWPVVTGAQLLPQLFQPSLSALARRSARTSRRPTPAGAGIARGSAGRLRQDVRPADFVPQGCRSGRLVQP